MNPTENFLSRHLTNILLSFFGLGCLLFFGVFTFAIRVLKIPPTSADNAAWGQLGDFLGGTLNPIFGFLGFTAVLTTLYIQKRELTQTLNELKQSREIASQGERISRINAQISAVNSVLNMKQKQADEELKAHSVIQSTGTGKPSNSPILDQHHWNMYLALVVEIKHYSKKIEVLLQELTGEPAPQSETRKKLNEQVISEVFRLNAPKQNSSS
jgi:hypothetical protein